MALNASSCPQPRPRRFPWRLYAGILAAILVVALAPVASVLLASLAADIAGCRLDEAGVHPCLIGGSDWGGTLYGFFLMGWLALATLPLAAMASCVWVSVLLIHFLVTRRRGGRKR